MAVPSRVEACRVLLSVDPPGWLIEHCTVVGEVGAFLARRARQHGSRLDVGLVDAAAVLHDIDKALPDNDRRGLDHGRAGAAWLAEHSLGELSSAIADHPVTRLSDDATFERWWREASLEDRIVAYADKRALQRLVSMDRRFADWQRRYPENERRQRVGRERAERLERQVCAAAGIAPADVRRLRWVGRAMADAR